eukprot:scaffold19591_cov141-Isochrysis_galbana.AAC.3
MVAAAPTYGLRSAHGAVGAGCSPHSRGRAERLRANPGHDLGVLFRLRTRLGRHALRTDTLELCLLCRLLSSLCRLSGALVGCHLESLAIGTQHCGHVHRRVIHRSMRSRHRSSKDCGGSSGYESAPSSDIRLHPGGAAGQEGRRRREK